MIPNARKNLFFTPVVSVAERLWRRRSLYQDTMASFKVMEEGYDILFFRFGSRMLMCVVPGVLGALEHIRQWWDPGWI